MSITWDETGARAYEVGIDHGVFYPTERFASGEFGSFIDGVPWNGLISVEESISGGSADEYYFNGFKYLTLISTQDYKAKIQAFAPPAGFPFLDGRVQIRPGLILNHQQRNRFGLSYRSRIGSDLETPDNAYELHLIYNAISETPTQNNSTINETVNPMTMDWNIHATPPSNHCDGSYLPFFPTAHLTIDSRFAPSEQLEELEALLYGAEATLPRQCDVLAIFEVV